MRKVAGSDTIIDRMITGDNEIIFNLISLIQSDANAVEVLNYFDLFLVLYLKIYLYSVYLVLLLTYIPPINYKILHY